MAKPVYTDHPTPELRVMASPCGTCIAVPSRMHLEPGRRQELVDACARAEGHIVCHETLGDGEQGAICRWWFDHHGDGNAFVRLARGLSFIRLITLRGIR